MKKYNNLSLILLLMGSVSASAASSGQELVSVSGASTFLGEVANPPMFSTDQIGDGVVFQLQMEGGKANAKDLPEDTLRTIFYLPVTGRFEVAAGNRLPALRTFDCSAAETCFGQVVVSGKVNADGSRDLALLVGMNPDAIGKFRVTSSKIKVGSVNKEGLVRWNTIRRNRTNNRSFELTLDLGTWSDSSSESDAHFLVLTANLEGRF